MPKKTKREFPFSSKIICSFLLACLLACLACCVYIVQGKNQQTTGAGMSSKRSLPIYCVDTQEKKISISFDCAWGADHTQTLLDILEKNGVRCTFFAVEFWVKKFPALAQKIVDAGHELGTHSRSHPYMSKLSKEEIQSELETSCKAIEETTGVRPILFRCPYGDYNNLVIDTAKEQNLFTIQWNVDSLDWKNLSASEIAMRVVGGVKNGSIILCHNNGANTAKALPLILSSLQNKGYTFVPISQLIYKENYYIDTSGKQHAS